MKNVNLKYKQSTQHLLQLATKEQQPKTEEEILQTMTAKDVTVIVKLGLSFKLAQTGAAVAADTLITVNNLLDYTAFSAQLQVEYFAMKGAVFLRSVEPQRWLFRSRLRS